MSSESLHILGIDGGIATFGVAILRVLPGKTCLFSSIEEAIFHGTQVSKNKSRIRVVDDLKSRYLSIGTFLESVIDSRKYICASMEAPSYSTAASVSNRLRTASVYGVVYEAFRKARIPLYIYTPRDIKLHWLGDPSGSKEAIQQAVESRYPEFSGWPKAKDKKVHTVDAAAVAAVSLSAPEVVTAARMVGLLE